MKKRWSKQEYAQIDYVRGAKAAASVAGDYDGCSTHEHRLEDLVLGKLHIGRRRPRKNQSRVKSPDDAWTCGFALALAEMHRHFQDSSSVCAVARDAGLTVASAKAAGVDAYDWKELKRAGVAVS